jgi:proline iminopeptidase
MIVTEGYVTAADGVRLFFQKVGDGRSTVVVPNAVYMFDDFKRLAAEHTCIFYDLRNRGRSDEVADDAMLKGGVHNDVQDLEAVRRHFELENMSVLGHSIAEWRLLAYSVEKLVAGMPPENSNAFGRSRMESAEETVTFDDVVS